MAEMKTDVLPEDVEPPEEVFTNLTEFLGAIHPRFLDLVFPISSGLVDELRSSKVFDSDSEDKIKNKKSRKDQARKCWNLMSQVPPGRFQTHCLPALKAKCTLAVWQKTFRWDGKEGGCLRHTIQGRMGVKRLADIFPHVSGCSQEEYRRLTESDVVDEALWDLAFKLCAMNLDNSIFRDQLQTILRNIHASVPDNLQALLASGLPCMCDHQTGPEGMGKRRKQKTKKKKQRKRLKNHPVKQRSHMNAKKYQLLTNKNVKIPKDLPSTITKDPGRQESPSAVGANNNNNNINNNAGIQRPGEDGWEAGEGEEDCYFQSAEQKAEYLAQLESTNTAIRTVCCIKPVYLELSGLEAELQTIREKTRADLSQGGVWQDDFKTRRCLSKIRSKEQQLQGYYQERSRIWQEREQRGPGAGLPRKYSVIIQHRNHVLNNELIWAEEHHTKCRDILNRLNLEYRRPPAVEGMAPWSEEVPAHTAQRETDELSEDCFYEQGDSNWQYQDGPGKSGDNMFESDGDEGMDDNAEYAYVDASMFPAVGLF